MLDPTTTQILIAELQDGVIEGSVTVEPAVLRRSTATLVRVARLLDIPVTLTAAPRPGGARMIDELAGFAPPVVRGGPGGWDDPTLRGIILDHDRPHLVIAGVTTEIVVLHTALDALAAGLSVSVPVDLCGGLSRRTEDAALDQITAAGGTVTSVVSLVSDMVRDFTTPVGRETIAALHASMG